MATMEQVAALPFSANAKCGVKKVGATGWVGTLKNDAGEIIDYSVTVYYASHRARDAAWREWRYRCNARNKSQFWREGDGWDNFTSEPSGR